MNLSFSEQVRQTALDAGAALVGFAPISRFTQAPTEQHPRTIFPATRTAIAIAVPQARGALKAVEDGCYWQAYNCDSYWYLNEVEAPRILRACLDHLEQSGRIGSKFKTPFTEGKRWKLPRTGFGGESD